MKIGGVKIRHNLDLTFVQEALGSCSAYLEEGKKKVPHLLEFYN